MASDSPPSDRTASSHSRRNLRTTAQDPSHRTVISSLGGQSESAGPYDRPQVIQNLGSEQRGSQSDGNVRRRSSRKVTALPDAPPLMLIDPQPSELNKSQPTQVRTQAGGHPGGAVQSPSDPRSTPSDRSASRRGVRGGKDSRGPPVRGNDRGRPRSGVRPNDPIPSRMPLVLILAYLYLTQFASLFST